jgi:hypothetical protein
MRVFWLALLTLISFNASAAPDKPLQGIDLARACRSDVVTDQSLCRGFLDGFTYGSQISVGSEFIGQWRYGGQTWCFPREIDETRVRQTLLDFAQKNTGMLHFPAAVVLANALATAFPCK